MQRLLNPREKVILFITFSVVIFGLVLNFLILPVAKKNNALDSQIFVKREKLEKYLLLLKHSRDIQDKYKTLSAGKALLAQDKDSLVDTLSEIEAVAKQAGIRIIDIRPTELKQKKEISVDFRAEATIEAYIQFIYNIENSLSLLRIKKFQLNAKPNTSTLEGSFSVSRLQISD